MTWALLGAVLIAIGIAVLARFAHRRELMRMVGAISRQRAHQRAGDAAARVQEPVIDLSRCLGCATCVAVCPEGGVLEIVHGQAVVSNGARCQGIAACERECPAGAIEVRLANRERRDDLPWLDSAIAAHGVPGMFLAGEVTARALIRVAIEHGTLAARAAAERVGQGPRDDDRLDLCIVGAGPGGLACALEATRLGLRFVLLEQESEIGGTVARYPRNKLVLSEPVTLPLFGRLGKRSYRKEDIIALWRTLADEHRLPVLTSARCEDVVRDDDEFVVHAGEHRVRARSVCLALGRRGSPRRLGVPGEDLPKVVYSLLDAGAIRSRRIMVVGGGDSAVETALALAANGTNEVTLVHRRSGFVRVRGRNSERIEAAIASGAVRAILSATPIEITSDAVIVECDGDHRERRMRIANDDVFVMIGGEPPRELLAKAGVAFLAKGQQVESLDRVNPTAWPPALVATAVLALATAGFAVWHADYYRLPADLRATHESHRLLRSAQGLGLGLGIAATTLIFANLAYLLRRARIRPFWFGSLRTWMSAHVVTGVAAFLTALLHAALAPRSTPGGHALLAMLVILVTGAIGRWIYAFVPRRANGEEAEIEEVRERVEQLARDPADEFGTQASMELMRLIEQRQWRGTLLGRIAGLVGLRLDLWRALRRLRARGIAQGVPATQLEDALALGREAHARSLAAAHYEDLRAVLASWRWLHRWAGLLLVILLVVHIVYAIGYGSVLSGGLP
jgi:thioredoxin reductase/Pyruvate/2-oxoacid:ferredoxin oxidoreductase delta subunit